MLPSLVGRKSLVLAAIAPGAIVALAATISAIPVATRIGASSDFLQLKEGLGHKQGIAGFLK